MTAIIKYLLSWKATSTHACIWSFTFGSAKSYRPCSWLLQVTVCPWRPIPFIEGCWTNSPECIRMLVMQIVIRDRKENAAIDADALKTAATSLRLPSSQYAKPAAGTVPQPPLRPNFPALSQPDPFKASPRPNPALPRLNPGVLPPHSDPPGSPISFHRLIPDSTGPLYIPCDWSRDGVLASSWIVWIAG